MNSIISFGSTRSRSTSSRTRAWAVGDGDHHPVDVGHDPVADQGGGVAQHRHARTTSAARPVAVVEDAQHGDFAARHRLAISRSALSVAPTTTMLGVSRPVRRQARTLIHHQTCRISTAAAAEMAQVQQVATDGPWSSTICVANTAAGGEPEGLPRWITWSISRSLRTKRYSCSDRSVRPRMQRADCEW